MEVIWTQLAKITYREVLENLKKRWTKKQLKDFRNLTNELLEKIKSEQVVHPFANKKLDAVCFINLFHYFLVSKCISILNVF